MRGNSLMDTPHARRQRGLWICTQTELLFRHRQRDQSRAQLCLQKLTLCLDPFGAAHRFQQILSLARKLLESSQIRFEIGRCGPGLLPALHCQRCFVLERLPCLRG